MIQFPSIKKPIAYLVLTVAACFSTIPFLWMISTSLKNQDEIFVFPPIWIPSTFAWHNYVDAWYVGGLDFGWMFLNTATIVVPVTLFTVLSSALAAYAFARIPFAGRNLVFGLFLASLLAPAAPTIIPQFILFRELHWLDSFRPLIAPGLFGNAFAIFLLRQFFLGIPGELEDAAMIDGATRLHIWWRIFLLVSKPAIVTLAIFTLQGVYNDFLGPLIYINSSDKFTVQLGLATFRGAYTTRYDLLMAASVFTLLPILLLFLFAQRYFIESVNLSGLRG
jgi:ABC-type glycerol-3-phosphate transport system permease component